MFNLDFLFSEIKKEKMKNLTHIFNFGYVIILKEDKNEHLFLKIKNCSSKIQ
jgi:hypothetical protein